MKKHLVIGNGEIGSAIVDIFKTKFDVEVYDIVDGPPEKQGLVDIMHICIPYSDTFITDVIDYVGIYKPRNVVIHSTVAVGTTGTIRQNTGSVPVFHSPVRGKHPKLINEIKSKFIKYLSFDNLDCNGAIEVSAVFKKAGIVVKMVSNTMRTELGKLLSLARYGVYLALAKEQEDICDKLGLSYLDVVTDFEITRNKGVKEELKQPVLTPFIDYVGGHCVCEITELLVMQVRNSLNMSAPLIEKSLGINRGTVIWDNCKIYPTANIGKGVSIGAGTEIGENVIIGNNVRIGAQCFIPEGVTIESDVFIAPCVKFSNDKYPPSGDKEKWGKILVKEHAVIGMGSVILPGVTIGNNSKVGAGSIVTKSIPDDEMWYGDTAAKFKGKDKPDDLS